MIVRTLYNCRIIAKYLNDHNMINKNLNMNTSLSPDEWVETNSSNICFFPMDTHFYLVLWYYSNGLRMYVYRCLKMLVGLVFSHPHLMTII